MAGEIKLKVDPQALRQAKMANPNESRQVVTEEDVNGRTLALKREVEPDILPVPGTEAMPVKAVEAQQSKRGLKKRLKEIDIQNQQRKHPKRIVTAAEKNYYRTLILSIFVLIGGCCVMAAIFAGVFSIYLITRIIDDPGHGVTIHLAAGEAKKAEGISAKYAVLAEAYEKIREPYIAPYIEEEKEGEVKKVVRGVTGYVKAIESAKNVSGKASRASGADEQ